MLLPQGAAVPVTHVAIYKLGAVALPLATLFGVDALSYRLHDAGAKAIVINAGGVAKLRLIAEDLPDLSVVLSLDGPDGPAEGFAQALEPCQARRRRRFARHGALDRRRSNAHLGNPAGARHS